MDNLGLGGSVGFLDLGNPPRSQIQLSMNMMMAGVENNPSIGFMDVKGSNAVGFSMRTKVNSSNAGNNNCCNVNNRSDEDEPSFQDDDNGEDMNGVKGKKASPWRRMKWTDNVVRLLIQVVASVGDDGTPEEGVEGMKRKSGVLHKKGKWKTVSKIMISKGCYVSPQQCEDKFNDLNKRYKKLNEILGRGTSCRVVENPVLMDSMPQLSPKMKEDVKKILISKHLFYKEMCAYHNGQRIPNCGDLDLQSSKETHHSDEENDESEDDESFNEETVDVKRNDNLDIGDFRAEIDEFFRDSTKSHFDRREWIKKQMLQLQEQRVEIQAEAFEMEKRYFKWRRFCSKKSRELEISRLENERLMLENERMRLQLKQAEMDIVLQKLEASFVPAAVSIDRRRGRDQIDLHQ